MRTLRGTFKRVFFVTGILVMMIAATGCGSIETETANTNFRPVESNILDDRAVGR